VVVRESDYPAVPEPLRRYERVDPIRDLRPVRRGAAASALISYRGEAAEAHVVR
jgi:hypothetical protein